MLARVRKRMIDMTQNYKKTPSITQYCLCVIAIATILCVGCGPIYQYSISDGTNESAEGAIERDSANDDINDDVLTAFFDWDTINDINNIALLTRLGYTPELLMNIFLNKTGFSENNYPIDFIVESLPPVSFWECISFSLQESDEINIIYRYDGDEKYNKGGNGLDAFSESVVENNALLLFVAIDNLKKVNFLYGDPQASDRTNSYTIIDLSERFGQITPRTMSPTELFESLAANIQLSEFYFAHYSRIYLGAEFEEVSYRNNEPDKIIQKEDGSTIWIYLGLEKHYKTLPSGEMVIADPGQTAVYFFNNPQAKKNDGLTGLYATIFYEDDGEGYDDLVAFLGLPTIIKAMDNGDKYIAYLLRDGQQRNAYFILREDKVIAQGVMYGNDYTLLSTMWSG